MRRTQSITITVEHRRLTLLFAPGADPEASPVPVVERAPPSPDSTVCLQCGAPWVCVNVPDFEGRASEADALWSDLEQRGLHLRLSPGGVRGICRKSLEQARFKATKESHS